MRNKMKNVSIMYLNIRGLKSKLESLKEIIDEQKPDIIALVETLLCENDAIELKNYEIIRNDREAGGGGVLIAIKKEMKSIVIEDGTCKETTDTLWIRIYNKKEDIRLGVIYNPQESKTTKEDLNKLYKNIEKQVQATIHSKQKLLIVGDFNCKIGTIIDGNKEEVTVGGKILRKMMIENKLTVVNSLKCTKGLWTREQGDSKSIIDFVITKTEDETDILNMIIDENKWISPMRIIKKDGINTIVYSDHNVIKISINWTTGYTSESLGRDSKIMSTNGYRKYREHLTKIGISKIWKEDGDLQEKYERWDRLVKEIKEKYETRKKKNKGRKVSRQLRRCIREIKKDKHNRDIAETRIVILKEEIINEEKASFASKINRTVEELKKEGGAVDQ